MTHMHEDGGTGEVLMDDMWKLKCEWALVGT